MALKTDFSSHKAFSLCVIPHHQCLVFFAVNTGLNSIVLASITLGLNKLLFVMAADIFTQPITEELSSPEQNS